MPWKMNGDAIDIKDGNPVWVYADTGKEVPVDGQQTFAKIAELTTKANERKRELDAATAKLSAIGDVEDVGEWVKTANKALETVQNLDSKKLIDAGEVEKVRNEVKSSMQKVIDDLTGKLSASDQALNKEMIGGRFTRSEFVNKSLTLPPEIAQKYFGEHFKIEDGRVVAYDQTGNKIYSQERPGELADFDEAIVSVVNAYPGKDKIVLAPDRSGSGAPQGGPAPQGGAKTITRTQFNGLGAVAQAAHVSAGGVVTD